MATVRLIVDVEVHEPEKVVAYAHAHREQWGLDPGEELNVAEAVMESLVTNAVAPLDIGCEIVNKLALNQEPPWRKGE